MHKIASPTELHSEIAALIQANREGATREDLAESLRDVASRLLSAGDRVKLARTYNLQDMARDLVGDGKSPNLFFITDAQGKVLVIVNSTLSEAKRITGLVSGAYRMEDRKHGEVWGSPEYEQNQWNYTDDENDPGAAGTPYN